MLDERWCHVFAVSFLFLILFSPGGLRAASERTTDVTLVRVPGGGIQPQAAMDGEGALHVVYYDGDPRSGDLFYVRSENDGGTFSPPVRVNSQPGSAVATGTIRGAQIALGAGGRVHVVWNGAVGAGPKGALDPERAADDPHNGLPMLYSRLDDAQARFEPQRGLMKRTFGLDGGGSVAADGAGNVYVVWHARGRDSAPGENGRGVWLAVSRDGGRSFSREVPAGSQSNGACGCCGLRAFADSGGRVYALYRTARELVHRDVHLLVSADTGRSFREAGVHTWNVAACPMSAMSFTEGAGGVLGAWQTGQQVYFAAIDPSSPGTLEPVPAPGPGNRRKYPALARGPSGQTMFLWSENAAWKTGGSLAWQVFDRDGIPVGARGVGPEVPDWSFGAVVVRGDGGFTVLY
jgi:hypothetical protein